MQGVQTVEVIPAGRVDAAYDRYAGPLYGYCRSLLGEPAEAAGAVQDTFIIAAGRLDGLRDPGRLRAWLYAVARNECHRRLGARASCVPFGGAGAASGETADGSPGAVTADPGAQPGVAAGKPGGRASAPADVGAEAERAELRALVAAALAGLGPGDREVLELNLRHGLAGRDLAAVLGVSPGQANALASRARSQFERSLGARPDLGPAILLGMLPAALPPAGLRSHLLSLAGDFSPASLAYRAEVIDRAGPFSRSGFPKPLDPPQVSHGLRTEALATSAGAAAVIVIGGILATSYGMLPPASRPASAPAVPSAAPGVTPSDPPAAAGPTVPANGPAPAAPGTSPLFPGAATPALAVPTSRSSPPASQSPTSAPGSSATPSTTPTPAPTTPTPAPTSPTPAPTTPTPAPTTPTPAPTTPTPAPTTPTPAPTTPTPAPTTPTPTTTAPSASPTSTLASPLPSLVAAP